MTLKQSLPLLANGFKNVIVWYCLHLLAFHDFAIVLSGHSTEELIGLPD